MKHIPTTKKNPTCPSLTYVLTVSTDQRCHGHRIRAGVDSIHALELTQRSWTLLAGLRLSGPWMKHAVLSRAEILAWVFKIYEKSWQILPEPSKNPLPIHPEFCPNPPLEGSRKAYKSNILNYTFPHSPKTHVSRAAEVRNIRPWEKMQFLWQAETSLCLFNYTRARMYRFFTREACF